MDNKNALLAILFSFIILLGYQYFFVPAPPENMEVAENVQEQSVTEQQPVKSQVQSSSSQIVLPTPTPVTSKTTREPEKVTVETDLYTAVISDSGGTIESFMLENYRETIDEGSNGKQLILNKPEDGFPLQFAWGDVVPGDIQYALETKAVQFLDDRGELKMSAGGEGLVIEKTYAFQKDSYLIDLIVTVKNSTGQTLQGTPQVKQVNSPFQQKTTANRFLFSGPAYFQNNLLSEVDTDDFEEGPKSIQGIFDWVAYEGTYFMCAIVPESKVQSTYTVQGSENLVHTNLTGSLDTLASGQEITYKYKIFYGPKKLSLLQEIGHNLDKSVDFGWFDIIARPTLALLNFLYNFIGNYGVAIILVTIIIKVIFWYPSQKGLRSMKNMQKLQPKMMKIKEKYKDDPQAMNREVMNLYRTYKVNPLGGCWPMLLQIPVFFALYKVLLMCIELRHAPFMLWITDLSAPDRLWIGFEIPWLGGLPVLTLLMGASMFIQQKLNPTTLDPMQARMMMMLPVVFTFMFLSFASGLVLYWFVSNLLAILQQQLINRGVTK